MKKIILIILLSTFISCHYSPNRRINDRIPPVVVLAIDVDNSSVVLRDGENKVFTIYDTKTTNAISATLSVGDTVRLEDKKIIFGDF